MLKFLILFLFIIILTGGCTNTERIGNFRYKTKTEKVFIDDYGGMTISIKSYYLGNEFQAGCKIKAQKLDFGKQSDTVFSKGFITIDNKNKRLVCREYYLYGYSEYLNMDSSVKIFEQQLDGKLKRIE